MQRTSIELELLKNLSQPDQPAGSNPIVSTPQQTSLFTMYDTPLTDENGK
eukprot:UN05293